MADYSESGVHPRRREGFDKMLKVFLAAMFLGLASLAAPSAAVANYRNIDHSHRNHHPHSRPHHREWSHRR
jgi:hypothetical protein